MSELKITIPQFITHVRKRAPLKGSRPSKAKSSPYFKLGGNAFYSQSLHHFERAYVVKQIHDYLNKYIPTSPKILKPIRFELHFYAPRNYGDISIRKDKLTGLYDISWKPYNPDYKASWDLDNAAYIWRKVIIDHLRGKIDNGIKVSKGLIEDDSIEYLKEEGSYYHEVLDIKDRKLEIILKEI